MAIPITRKVQMARENHAQMGGSPVIVKDLEPGIKGEANDDGTIYIDESVDLNSSAAKKIIAHEEVHMDQMDRGDLSYDEENVYWKGNTYPREKMNEGSKHLPWEKEAYNKTKNA